MGSTPRYFLAYSYEVTWLAVLAEGGGGGSRPLAAADLAATAAASSQRSLKMSDGRSLRREESLRGLGLSRGRGQASSAAPPAGTSTLAVRVMWTRADAGAPPRSRPPSCCR